MSLSYSNIRLDRIFYLLPQFSSDIAIIMRLLQGQFLWSYIGFKDFAQ